MRYTKHIIRATCAALLAFAAPASAQDGPRAGEDTSRVAATRRHGGQPPARAGDHRRADRGPPAPHGRGEPRPAPRRPTSRADSLTWERHRRAANSARGRRIVVSIFDRRLWLIDGADTLLSAPAGVGMGVVKSTGGRLIDFSTPRGRRTVIKMEEDPLWIPPDWHYQSMADRVRQFPAGGVALKEGGRVIRRGVNIGILKDGEFEILPQEHPLMWDGIMYIPPFGTINRRVPEVLGKFKLDTGDGYFIHGTNDPIAIGFPATHGCIRLDEEPLTFLYENTTVGTAVYIY
jgi:lipoprotein-anchoring transpeptidase ErfK/SrfK